MSKDKLIPTLRFPEFKYDGEWRDKTITKIGETVNGLSGKKGDDFGKGKPYVQYKQVFNKSFIDFSECGKVDVSDDENQNQLQLGDILFTTSSETPDEVGFSSVIVAEPKEPTYLNSFCFVLRPYELDEIKPIFSRYLFHSPIYRKSVSAIAQGSTRYNLSKGAFLKLKVPVPKPQEQQKIASCLSSLDELIVAHNDKLDALKDHKKGLMQNLFPQEGETLPKYRFPEFEKDGEWEEKKLGECVDFVMGNAFRSEDFVEDGLQLIRMGNLYQGKLQLNRTPVFLPKSFEAEYSRFLVKPRDLLMSMTGTMGKKDYGFVIEIPENSPVLLLNQRVLKIIPRKTSLEGFVLQQLKNDTFLDKLYSIPGGTKQANLSTKDLKEIKVSFPSIQEQQKIASSLSSLDALITAQAEKIEQLQLHKKGLMQGLFPKSIMN